jgi:hypothetical protein
VGEIDAAMADVSATLLARAGQTQLHACDGRVLNELLVQPPSAAAPAADSSETLPAANSSRLGEARVAARLRRLGYIE